MTAYFYHFLLWYSFDTSLIRLATFTLPYPFAQASVLWNKEEYWQRMRTLIVLRHGMCDFCVDLIFLVSLFLFSFVGWFYHQWWGSCPYLVSFFSTSIFKNLKFLYMLVYVQFSFEICVVWYSNKFLGTYVIFVWFELSRISLSVNFMPQVARILWNLPTIHQPQYLSYSANVSLGITLLPLVTLSLHLNFYVLYLYIVYFFFYCITVILIKTF